MPNDIAQGADIEILFLDRNGGGGKSPFKLAFRPSSN